MKVILLQHLSGAKSYEAGQEIEVTDLEALRFIDKGIAKESIEGEYKALVSRVKKLAKKEEDKQIKLLAVQKETELKEEAEALLGQLMVIVSVLESIDQNYRSVFIDSFHEKFTAIDTVDTGTLSEGAEQISTEDNKDGEAE